MKHDRSKDGEHDQQHQKNIRSLVRIHSHCIHSVHLEANG